MTYDFVVDTPHGVMSNARLFQLAAMADEQLHQFISPGDDQDSNQQASSSGWPKNRIGLPAGALAAGAGGYLAYKNRKNLVPLAQQKLAKTGGLLRQGEDALLKKATAANVPYSATKGVAGVIRRAQGKGSSILGKVAKGAEKLMTKFSRRDLDRLVNLAARVTDMEMREFDGAPEPQRGKIGMYAVGGVPALLEQSRYKKSGLVYRKRDALGDGSKGALAGYGTLAAGIGAGAGVTKLAKDRMLPKGMLRKGAVKIAQTLKKSPLAAVAGAGLAGTAAGMAVSHGSAEKRRKALLAQRLQGATA